MRRRFPSGFTLLERLLALRERLAALFRRLRGGRGTADRRARLGLAALEPRLVPARPLPDPVIFAATGPGSAPELKGYAADTGDLLFSVQPYATSFTGGVRVSAGDITGDGIPDAVTAPGFGHTPLVRVWDGVTGDPVPGSAGAFLAFGKGVTPGVWVSAADVDGDGKVDILAAARTPQGTVVRSFAGDGSGLIAQFTAAGPAFRLGVSLGSADFDGDGLAEVVVGAAGSDEVRVYDPLGGATVAGVLGSFHAFGPGHAGGVAVNADGLASDVDSDGTPDIAVAAGRGNAGRVKVFGGDDLSVLLDLTPFGSDSDGPFDPVHGRHRPLRELRRQRPPGRHPHGGLRGPLRVRLHDPVPADRERDRRADVLGGGRRGRAGPGPRRPGVRGRPRGRVLRGRRRRDRRDVVGRRPRRDHRLGGRSRPAP